MISVMRFAGTLSAFASERAERPRGTRNSSRRTSPGWVRMRAMSPRSMIVHDLDAFRSVRRPAETDAPLPVDPNTELASAVAFERLELIARWRTQVIEPHRRVQHIELAFRHGLKGPPVRRADTVAEEPLSRPVSEAPDHGPICDT